MYNGRMRKLYEGTRGGKYVISSGRKVYLKVKSSKKKAPAKHKPTKKKPGPKKKKSTSGLRMPRMSNLRRFKLFGGNKDLFISLLKDINNINKLTFDDIISVFEYLSTVKPWMYIKLLSPSGSKYTIKTAVIKNERGNITMGILKKNEEYNTSVMLKGKLERIITAIIPHVNKETGELINSKIRINNSWTY